MRVSFMVGARAHLYGRARQCRVQLRGFERRVRIGEDHEAAAWVRQARALEVHADHVLHAVQLHVELGPLGHGTFPPPELAVAPAACRFARRRVEDHESDLRGDGSGVSCGLPAVTREREREREKAATPLGAAPRQGPQTAQPRSQASQALDRQAHSRGRGQGGRMEGASAASASHTHLLVLGAAIAADGGEHARRVERVAALVRRDDDARAAGGQRRAWAVAAAAIAALGGAAHRRHPAWSSAVAAAQSPGIARGHTAVYTAVRRARLQRARSRRYNGGTAYPSSSTVVR